MFGGNSNWRGPVWFPLNFLLIEALQKHDLLSGRRLQGRMPDRLGRTDVAVAGDERSVAAPDQAVHARRERPPSGARPHEKFQTDPHWKDLILFYEYFDGDTGAGLGASHQTGWTGARRQADPAARRVHAARRSRISRSASSASAHRTSAADGAHASVDGCRATATRRRVARGRRKRRLRARHRRRHAHPALSRAAADGHHAAFRTRGTGERVRGVARLGQWVHAIVDATLRTRCRLPARHRPLGGLREHAVAVLAVRAAGSARRSSTIAWSPTATARWCCAGAASRAWATHACACGRCCRDAISTR